MCWLINTNKITASFAEIENTWYNTLFKEFMPTFQNKITTLSNGYSSVSRFHTDYSAVKGKISKKSISRNSHSKKVTDEQVKKFSVGISVFEYSFKREFTVDS